MPIEFQCSSCHSKLKVPDEYAGKKAKCPKCSNLNTIPDAFDPLEPLSMEPFSMESTSGGMDFSAPMDPPPKQSTNPYSSSSSASSPRPAPRRRRGLLVLRKVDVTSAALMFGGVYACIGLIYMAFVVFFGFLGFAATNGQFARPGFGVGFAIGGLVIAPIIMGIGGMIGGAILGGLFNLVAQVVGGLKFETD